MLRNRVDFCMHILVLGLMTEYLEFFRVLVARGAAVPGPEGLSGNE